MRIRRATRDDLADIATVASRAMMKDDLSLWLSPRQHQFPYQHRQRCLRTTLRRWNSGLFMLVAETDSSDKEWDGKPQVIGYAAYEKEVGATDDSSKTSASWFGAFERFLSKIQHNYDWYFRNNLGTDKARWHECGMVISANQALHSYERYWELDFLAVDPNFGRRGIGAALMDWGMEQANRDQVPLLLWASEMGYPLYKRKGFEEIGEMIFGGQVRSPVMAWTPPSMRT